MTPLFRVMTNHFFGVMETPGRERGELPGGQVSKAHQLPWIFLQFNVRHLNQPWTTKAARMRFGQLVWIQMNTSEHLVDLWTRQIV